MRESTDWRAELEASTATQIEHLGAAPVEIPGLTILYHPDLRRIGEQVLLPALGTGRSVALSRLVPSFAPPRDGEPRPLADSHISRTPLHLASGSAKGLRLERGAAPTAASADGRDLESTLEITAESLRRGVVLLLAHRIVLLLHHLDPLPPPHEPDLGLLGQSAAMLGLRREVRRVAALPVPLLLRGETGSGKELVARAIHRESDRRHGPHVTVNMAAIPQGLAAAELFGAAKGAFTGAGATRDGFFRQAEGGTLLLDEIGETPLEVQALLLRALESGEIQPVGGQTTRRVDLRILAATDADLESAVADGRFRAPLLHRLEAYEIVVPPLRERRQDIPLMLLHFLRQELSGLGHGGRLGPSGTKDPWLPAPLVARLAQFDWPGNVRQLRNLARHLALSHHDAERIRVDRRIDKLLEREPQAPPQATPRSPTRSAGTLPARRLQPSQISLHELRSALRAHGFAIKPSARALGISRASLYELIDRHPELRRASEIERAEIERGLERWSGDVAALADELEISKHGLLHRMRELKIA